ncbi:hypothetical protein H9Q72_004424 [Fusarium xylarioides]|uniref:Uncharacterized protein n=1 Tax=Fusarium xylarioides TaxID=221167 RepID=A0A9P7L7R6_9HYPO|nr:hypothetical protein H9Q70_001952 [Fusarium xylarioides]KAG5767860.1 hypothetical protein H9Q72_004424 [Fusarium xylarioides]KAG5820156.1 hypothetical protein H9Q71_000694 [Fusarium xylarioides]KAG5829214.1 hypothetical protein H9Q74_000699 [Fusarium xylarioides]
MDHYERIKRFQSCHRKSTHGNDKICSSWVYSPESNVHITRDREWFEDDYMAFSSIVYHTHDEPWSNAERFTNHGLELNPEHYTWAHGVGTVILKTKRSPNRRPNTKGNKNMSELVLKNVILAPNYICNVIGGNIAQDGYVARVGPGSIKCEGEIRDSTGFQVAHFRNNRNTMQQIEVRIWGPPLGRELKERSAFPTRIRLDLPYFKHDIQAKWPAEERHRFESDEEREDEDEDESGWEDTDEDMFTFIDQKDDNGVEVCCLQPYAKVDGESAGKEADLKTPRFLQPE